MAGVLLDPEKKELNTHAPGSDSYGYHLKKIFEFTLIRFVIIAVIVILQLHATVLYAVLQTQITTEKLSSAHGLSQNSVMCILKDSRGFMWFGTQDGLNKYDGYNFTSYRHIPFDKTSIGNSSITQIIEDDDNNLWIATLNEGLFQFDRNTEQFTYYGFEPGNDASISSNEINDLVYNAGTLWIGTKNNGLCRFDIQTRQTQRYEHKNSDPKSLVDNLINDLHLDRIGNLWIATSAGLDKFNPVRGEFEHYTFASDVTDYHLKNNIYRIYEDSRGLFWIGSWFGLDNFNPQSGNFSTVFSQGPFTQINCMIEDSRGDMWLGTRKEGIIQLVVESGTYSKFTHDKYDKNSISSNEIKSLFEDEFGTIWIGTKDGGINKLKQRSIPFSNFGELQNGPLSLNVNLVYSLFEDENGIIWVGTGGGGLNKIDLTSNITKYYIPNSQSAHAFGQYTLPVIYKDTAGRFWCGTAGEGLQLFNTDTGLFTVFGYKSGLHNNGVLISRYILDIYEDSEGSLWLSTPHGLNHISRDLDSIDFYQNDPADPQSISSNSVYCTFETSTGELLVGTGNGLNIFNRTTGTFTHYRYDPDDESSIGCDIIWYIFEDSNGNIWLGTWGGGLNRFHPETKSFSHYDMSDGLPNNVVYGILEDDDGDLWFSTNEGITCFEINNEFFMNYTEDDGLQCSEFSVGACFKNDIGEMMFGGVYGLTVFNPHDLRKNVVVPPVYITDFFINNEKASFESEIIHVSNMSNIVIEHFMNDLSFEFASLDFTSPRKNQYKYKLDGFDSDWIASGNRRYAGYTQLEPGSYVFRVRGTNSDGVWSDNEASIHISIKPPLWDTIFFKMVMFIVVIGILAGGYRIRINYLKKTSDRLSMFTGYLNEAIEKERNYISREIHDELGQALTALKMNVSWIGRNMPDEVPHMYDRIENVSDLINSTINKVRKISENLRPSRLDELGLVTAVEWYVEEFQRQTGVVTSLYIDAEDIELGDMERTAVFRIIQESLTNVARHAHASIASVILTKSNNNLEIIVSDDGIGFDEKMLENIKSFGIMGIRERVRQLKGTFIIDSNARDGCSVKVTIPF
ncbi:two-component regulator propeller domain-containing protein [Candidatus Latescibacterota bacterium]